MIEDVGATTLLFATVGMTILLALVLGAVPVRMLTIPAIAVIVVWSGFAIYAGRRFDGQSAKGAERRLEEAVG